MDDVGGGKEKFKETISQCIRRIFFVNNEITKSDDRKNGRKKEIMKQVVE